MSWFGKKSAPPPTSEPKAGDPFRQERENDEAYRRLAREAEPCVLAQADAVLADFQTAHDRDAASYHFECKRFGDFLTVFMTRNRRDPVTGGLRPERFSASINLAGTRKIVMRPGHAPDRNGRVYYRPVIKTSSEAGCFGWAASSGGLPLPLGGAEREVRPDLPWVNDHRDFLRERDDGERAVMHLHPQSVGYATDHFPRPAEDDAVEFTGVGISVLAPAGLGQAVINKIMAEIAENAPASSVLE